MKKIMKLLGIIALTTVIGFSFTACKDSTGDDTSGGNSTGGNELPASVGDNPVGGKIYYEGDWEKIEFAASTGTSGKYTGYNVRYDMDRDGYVLDTNGKYLWYINKTGTYTWNEDQKTVTLRPEKISDDNGKFLNKTEFKAYLKDYWNSYIDYLKNEEGMTQAQADAYIREMLADLGYSSITQLADAQANEAFGNHPYTYSFSNDGKSLFMQELLPQSKGTDELAGKTYNGTRYDYEQDKRVKVPNEEYVFSSNKTYTYKYHGEIQETGTYSYDSTDSTRKEVYFRSVTMNGKTAVEYYETVSIWGDNHYINDDAYKAAETNLLFNPYKHCEYNPAKKLIGWFDAKEPIGWPDD